jgi:hypothetical protein
LTDTIHIANDHGVSLFKTCTAEVFRPVPIYENTRFSCAETRKDSAVHVSLSSSSLVKQPGTRKPHSRGREVRKTLFRRQMTTDLHRLLLHSSKRGASRARKHALACGPMQRRAQWAGYRPARLALSTVLSTNRRIIRQNFATQRSRYFCRACAALEPQSCDVLTYS